MILPDYLDRITGLSLPGRTEGVRMIQSKKDLFVKNIFTTVAPSMDFLNWLFSMGLCHVWREKAAVLARVRRNDKILDICTGTGDMALKLIKKMGPEGSLIGIDFCENMLDLAKLKMKKLNGVLPREISFVPGDAKELHFPDNTFDIVTVAFGIRNIPDTTRALNEVRRVLKPGGRFVCLELTRPTKKWFLPIYEWYTFRVMPFIAKYVVKKMTPYAYLPRSIEAFYPSEEFKKIMGQRGFANISAYPMTMGMVTIFTGEK